MTQSLTTTPEPTTVLDAIPDALTLVMPLRATASISLAEVCSAVHPCRVDRTTTTKHDGRMTLTGIRGVRVADLIHKLRADSQDTASVHAMFMAETAAAAAV